LGTGNGRGFFGRAFAVRGSSSDAKGSGTPSWLPLTLAVACLTLLLTPAVQAAKVPGFGVLGTGLTGSGASQLGNTPQGLATNSTGAGGVSAGDVYVSDAINNRVSQYAGSGAFVRTWGWDVASSGEHNTGTNEQQNVTVKATGGNFTLTVTTAANGRGTVTSGSKSVTNVEPTLGGFHVGDAITGTGIPANTTIAAVVGSTLTLSANATQNNVITNLSAKETTASIPATAEATQVKAALEAKEGVGTVDVTGGPGSATGTTPYQVTFTGGPLSHNDIAQMTAAGVALTGGSPTSSVAVTTAVVGGGFEICQAVSTPSDVCQIGVANSLAGGLSGAQGLAVDPATGNVFVVSNTSKRVNVYSATGQFYGAFGWGVNATAPEAKLQFCTTATGCLAGSAGEGAGQFGTMTGEALSGSSPAVSPVNGHLFVPQPGNRRIDEFSFTLAGSEVTGVSFVKGFGGDVTPTVNEKQTVTLTGATGGLFALSFGGKSTDTTGTGDVEAGSNEVTNFKASDGAFVAGEEISGPGIPAGTRITATTFDSLTLTNAATSSASGATFGAALPFNAAATAVQGALAGLSSVGAGNVAVSGVNGGPYTVEFKGSLAGTDVAAMSGDATELTGTTPSVAIVTTQIGANGAGVGFETCTTVTACKAGIGDGRGGTFVATTPVSLAVDSTGSIYATGHAGVVCNPSAACGVQKFNAAATAAAEFAPAQLNAPGGAFAATASSRLVAVDPTNDHVLVAKRVTGFTFRIFEFTRTGSFIDFSPPGEAGLLTSVGGASASGPQGLAVGTGERAYYSIQGSGPLGTPVKILGNPPAPKATVEAPSGVSQTSATFTGVAQPSAPGIEGGFATTAWFEYSTDGVSWSATDPVEIGTGTGAGSPNTCPTGNPPSCNVSKFVGNLKAGTTYLVRLVVSNGNKTTSSTANFTTAESAPAVNSLSSEAVTANSATLTGQIEPNGESTSYHFEWGTDTGYGTRVPADFEAVAGGGSQPISVSIQVAGLHPATTYHFRIVASSASGTTKSADQELMTLNASGLPGNRGLELVSPADKKPVGTVGTLAGNQVFYQAAAGGGGVVYPIQAGIEGSNAGGFVDYSATRSASGWSNTQLTPPSLIPAPAAGTFEARTGAVRYVSPDLQCAAIETHNPLTADTPQVDIDNGVYNLYLWSAADGSYTLITRQPPLNPTAKELISNTYYEVAGITPDCSRVIFRSTTYKFTPGASDLYEWQGGTLQDAGLLPPSQSPLPAGAGDGIASDRYSFSSSGRLFFQATSIAGADSGKRAVFVRKSATKTVDASQPTTATPTLGAMYQGASPDGSHVFFLANYGLASTSSSGPAEDCSAVTQAGTKACDLYDYDIENETLTDISADTNPADPRGAVVQGVVDISEDGETVYFAALGQLVPGKGRTYAQNFLGETFANLYRYHDGELSYVGSLDGRSFSGPQNALLRATKEWVGQTTKSGDYLLFPSRADMTGTNPENLRQVYRYSALDETTVCVSCPSGRAPSADAVLRDQFSSTSAGLGGNYTPRSLSEDGRVFFNSEDALAPGAVEGDGSRTNVYEWYRGQLSLLTSGRAEMIDIGEDGRDVYVRSFEQLIPQDVDFAADIYDLRVGGGFAAPPTVTSCDPAADQCQGTSGTPPSASTPPSAGFTGPGSSPEKATKPKPKQCPKGKVRKHGKCVKKPMKKKKQKAKAQSKRAADNNRGGAK